MKNTITLENVQLASQTSFPAIIRVFEYNDKWVLDSTIDDGIQTRAGDMGSDKQYRYSVSTFPNVNDGYIGVINSKLKTTKFPIFTREKIFENFYVIKVADYGNQGMSAYYRDFAPYIFVNGRKVWNKYTAIIKDYVSKQAYILIDKSLLEENQKVISNILKAEETPNIIIDISLRDIIETTSDSSIITITNAINVDDNSISISGDYSFWRKNNLSNYNMRLYRDGKNYLIPLGYEQPYIKSFAFSKTSENTLDVSLLGDYFKQAFKEKYLTNPTTPDKDFIINRKEADITINISFDPQIIKLRTGDGIILESAQRCPVAKYETVSDVVSANILNDAFSYACYNKNGAKAMSINDIGSDSDEIEIVGRNIFRRTIICSDVSNSMVGFNPNAFLKPNGIYGYNSSFTVCVYSQNDRGEYLRTISDSTDVVKQLFLYDEGGMEVSEPTDSTSFSADKLSIKSSVSSFWNILGGLPITNLTPSSENSKSLINIRKVKPALILFQAEDTHTHPDIYAVSRTFPIKYNKYIIDDCTTYYQLPDWIIKDDPNKVYPFLNQNIKELELADGISKEFIDSLEPTIIMSEKLPESSFKIISPESFIFKSEFDTGGMDEETVRELKLEYPHKEDTPDSVADNNTILEQYTENSRIINFYGRNSGAIFKGEILTNDPSALVIEDMDGSLVYVGYSADGTDTLIPIITESI